jgi:hypothetical protein
MPLATKSIVWRIEWCRRQTMQACERLELDGWHAEEEGLRDALLNRDRSNQYRFGPSGVFERYAMGLRTGEHCFALQRWTKSSHTPANKAHG